MSEGFVFDTNVFLTAWNVHYRPSRFAPMWDLIDRCLRDGRIVAPRAVFNELTDLYDDGPAAWAKNRRELFPEAPREVQLLIAEIGDRAPGIVSATKRGAGDPWVIAFAQHLGFAVVTYEGVSPDGRPALGKGMNIPKACEIIGIECVQLADALDRLEQF